MNHSFDVSVLSTRYWQSTTINVWQMRFQGNLYFFKWNYVFSLKKRRKKEISMERAIRPANPNGPYILYMNRQVTRDYTFAKRWHGRRFTNRQRTCLPNTQNLPACSIRSRSLFVQRRIERRLVKTFARLCLFHPVLVDDSPGTSARDKCHATQSHPLSIANPTLPLSLSTYLCARSLCRASEPD